ncbi:MAG TPA: MarR family transcriptional regulator [Caulobacterales bacterium]|nr:MarR family transcriptional regulator [Caulobacterales bacterium]
MKLRADDEAEPEIDAESARHQRETLSGIEKSSVVLFLDALEKDGWVERRPHATDRRAHAVHLTRKGRARFEQVGKRLAAAQEEALAEFSAAERKQLEGLLVRLITHLS